MTNVKQIITRGIAILMLHSRKALLDHVDSEDKGVNEMVTPVGNQRVIFINESGLYSLVL